MVSAKEKKEKVWTTLEVEVELPEGVQASISENVLTVKGKKGEVSKYLRFPNVYMKVDSNKILIGTNKYSKSEKKIIFTYRAHSKNLIKGVTEGFEYNLIVVYAKFPMTVELKGTTFNVKNFLGEKVPRSMQVPAGVKVEIKGGKDIVVTGIDKEKTGQVAATIEQLTRINHLDRRVVQDGIFITKKPHVRYS